MPEIRGIVPHTTYKRMHRRVDRVSSLAACAGARVRPEVTPS